MHGIILVWLYSIIISLLLSLLFFCFCLLLYYCICNEHEYYEEIYIYSKVIFFGTNILNMLLLWLSVVYYDALYWNVHHTQTHTQRVKIEYPNSWMTKVGSKICGPRSLKCWPIPIHGHDPRDGAGNSTAAQLLWPLFHCRISKLENDEGHQIQTVNLLLRSLIRWGVIVNWANHILNVL